MVIKLQVREADQRLLFLNSKFFTLLFGLNRLWFVFLLLNFVLFPVFFFRKIYHFHLIFYFLILFYFIIDINDVFIHIFMPFLHSANNRVRTVMVVRFIVRAFAADPIFLPFLLTSLAIRIKPVDRVVAVETICLFGFVLWDFLS
jgi:hypothetical protein